MIINPKSINDSVGPTLNTNVGNNLRIFSLPPFTVSLLDRWKLKLLRTQLLSRILDLFLFFSEIQTAKLQKFFIDGRDQWISASTKPYFTIHRS